MADPVVLQDHTPGGVESTFYEVRVPVDPQCWPVRICEPVEVLLIEPVPLITTRSSVRERAWLLVTAFTANGQSPRDSLNDVKWQKMFDRGIELAEQFEATP